MTRDDGSDPVHVVSPLISDGYRRVVWSSFEPLHFFRALDAVAERSELYLCSKQEPGICLKVL